MNYGFIQQSRDSKVDDLIETSMPAFMLVTQIARRARRDSNGLNPHNLAVGEALLGDHKSIGLTQQQYRTAKLQLTKWEIATFKSTNKGTIGSLCDCSIYNINAEQDNNRSNNRSNNQGNRQPTTKKNDKKGEEGVINDADASASDQEFYRPSREELTAYILETLKRTQQDADHVWNVWQENDWTRSAGGGKRTPIKFWKMALNTWNTGHYFPSQRGDGRRQQQQEPTAAKQVKIPAEHIELFLQVPENTGYRRVQPTPTTRDTMPPSMQSAWDTWYAKNKPNSK